MRKNELLDKKEQCLICKKDFSYFGIVKRWYQTGQKEIELPSNHWESEHPFELSVWRTNNEYKEFDPSKEEKDTV